jgi:predicted DNA-binding protein (MmcQ/YjbR family)
MFCVANLEPGLSRTKIAFKCTPEAFAELVEVDGIIPAPYMARNHWVAILEMEALRRAEIEQLIRHSYHLVREKLPKRLQAKLEDAPSATGRKARPARSVKGRK